MSNPEKRTGPEKRPESLSDHLRHSLSFDKDERDKPDFRETDLGSPVSPLRSRGSGLTATTATTTTTTTTTTSSSSSSSGSVSGRMAPPVPVNKKSSDSHHSAESSPTGARGGAAGGSSRPSHRRTHSGGSQSSYSFSSGVGGGSASVTSPQAPVHLPAGNICPLGGVLRTGMASPPVKTDIVGSGRGQYGHGSIMRAGTSKFHGKTNAPTPPTNSRGTGAATGRGGSGLSSSGRDDPEELKQLGNDNFKRGNYREALKLYDRAIAISPSNAPYHYNRAAALIGLKRFGEAVRECEEAIRLDPRYLKAHQRLGSLLLSLGQVEDARKHLCVPGQQTDAAELLKLQAVEKHLAKCTNARRDNDWNSTFREAEAAMAAGADKCPQLMACQAEALLKLRKLHDPDTYISSISNLHTLDSTNSQSKFFGINSEAYLFLVRAKIELAMGRFENAITAAEQANQIDARNVEVSVLLGVVKAVSKSRKRGNDLFKSERYTEASSAYGEGLSRDPSNSVLYCNRAACFDKLCQYERAVEDCDQALLYQPNYIKALLRRARSNCKLERWAEAVRDYEVVRRTHPNDKEIAESLFQAQLALKKSRGEDVSNAKFGGEVELVSGLKHFRAEIASPAASVVHFLSSSNKECQQISPVLDKLCAKYPSINFLKVDAEKNPEIADAENVRIRPTIKIYKKGNMVKEIVCPSPEVLESFVKADSI
ncbi:OLC1v1023215C1 [Oldenlandia corymbosa var. corymbosa]|uniref:OLC1v1023215C1 n=1 Tax=Oldenlandia corymbosa var. corymbosa TaxID=529605 RepID=A0AAV1C0V5_OLDCO|nr:OLC1v1023215C1 [Oldenlandia corymbosa var. corymbosa]